MTGAGACVACQILSMELSASGMWVPTSRTVTKSYVPVADGV